MNARFFLCFLLLFFGAYPASGGIRIPQPVQYTYTIIREYPHDPKAFTQGLAWHDGKVYESTGLYGRSSLRLMDLQTGQVKRRHNYTAGYFAEGITVFRDRIYQLTWTNKEFFLFDKENFSLLKSRPYPREGWGITHDGKELIVSDGTAQLYFLDLENLKKKRRISVRDDQGPVTQLNELEYVQGAIYANVWRTDRIAIIRPEDGVVTGWLDLGGLCRRMRSIGKARSDVLNGIMYDPVGDRLFITGKLWPALFEIRVVPK